MEQPALDEHLRIGRRAVAEPGKAVVFAEPQLMVEQPAALAIEPVDEIGADEIGERRAVADRRAQITLHREFPVQAPAVRRIDEKIDFAERAAVAAQWQIGRDEPQRRPVRQEVLEQAFGVAAEPGGPKSVERAMQRPRLRIERGEPRLDGRLARRIRPWARERRARYRGEQARAGQQPAQIAHRDVMQRVDECERRVARHCPAGPFASAPSARRNVLRARHRSAHAFDLSCRLRNR